MSDNYKALVCSLSNVRPHPNADRLRLADASGYQIIVGLNARDGDRGMVIGAGSQLSSEFAAHHKLLRTHPTTGEKLGGYLEESCRVRPLSLRGERSDGIFIAMELPEFKDGDLLDSLEGFPSFVRKYETPSQLRRKEWFAANQLQESAKAKQLYPLRNFKQHYETAQLRNNLRLINSIAGELIITEKVHGTSGRTGHVLVDLPLGKLAKFWNFIVPERIRVKPKQEWRIVSGTRRCILADSFDPERSNDERGQLARFQAHEFWSSVLPQGVTAYYELVGYYTNGRSIMAAHSNKVDKDFPSSIVYSYGCELHGKSIGELMNGKFGVPQCKIFLYRATDSAGEIPFNELESLIPHWAREFVSVVPWLNAGLTERIDPDDPSTHLKASECHELSTGCSALDDRHPCEGVCVRVDADDQENVNSGRAFKYKGELFCMLEDIALNDPNAIDGEDVA